jgi:hypothetical protein
MQDYKHRVEDYGLKGRMQSKRLRMVDRCTYCKAPELVALLST